MWGKYKVYTTKVKQSRKIELGRTTITQRAFEFKKKVEEGKKIYLDNENISPEYLINYLSVSYQPTSYQNHFTIQYIIYRYTLNSTNCVQVHTP